MGADDGPHLEDGEGPIRNIWLNRFKISKTAVSNKEFKEFIDATGYRTVAEEIGTSFVFFKFFRSPSACAVSTFRTNTISITDNSINRFNTTCPFADF